MNDGELERKRRWLCEQAGMLMGQLDDVDSQLGVLGAAVRSSKCTLEQRTDFQDRSKQLVLVRGDLYTRLRSINVRLLLIERTIETMSK